MLPAVCCQLLVSIEMIKIGIICPSEIAFRRFMPALQKADGICFAGIAYANPEEWFGNVSKVDETVVKEQQEREYSKAQHFINVYSGKLYNSYQSLIESSDIDAVYIPLPPALHFKWAKMALECGKHVFVEKPSTTCFADTDTLIKIALEKGLALHENYMFVFHNQIKELNDIISEGSQVGKPRLYRITFGFPRRAMNDFRYNKKLGGGALLDAGGYTMKYASLLLGKTAKVTTAQVNYDSDFEVEIFGSATMVNDEGLTAQLAFGMDNDYRCDVEVWGSKGTITSGRILTAPVGCVPTYTLKQNQEYFQHNFSEDDAFYKSIQRFIACVNDSEIKKENYAILLKQGQLVQQFRDLSGLK